MLAIIDYGSSNLRSVQKAFERVGAKAVVTSDPAVIDAAPAVAFPGQGAFGDAMHNLRRLGLLEPIHRAVQSGKPFFGICVGMQVLMEIGEEMGLHQGLGIFPGRVSRFPDGMLAPDGPCKIPHIGWNQIHFRQPSPLLAGIDDGSFVYFDHSYYVDPADPAIVVATTDYGIDFASIVARDNVYAIQFHPEKSQAVGLRMLRNFVELAGIDR